MPGQRGRLGLNDPRLASGQRPVWNPERGPSARQILTIDWEYPVYDRSHHSTRTLASSERAALPVERAIKAIAGEDPRPLLVLRECQDCSGTDDALLSRKDDNERTVLLSHWFHCVKLPPDVLQEKHALRGLFSEGNPAHLFVASRDGSLRHDLIGDQSRTELWKAMEGVLREEYEDRADKRVKDLFRLLDKLDTLDEREIGLSARLEERIEKSGPGSSKVAKLRKDLRETAEERAKLEAQWKQAFEMTLRPRASEEGQEAPDEESVAKG